jgi:dienelactone hydrolase
MRNLLPILSFAFLVAPLLAAQDTEQKKQQEQEQDEGLTLERIFPEKSFFGPSARSASFSFDGKYAVWLWRPYLERRHGSDLWVLDVGGGGEPRRVTSASVLAPFQEQAREVVQDRVQKAKAKAEAKEKEKQKAQGAADAVKTEEPPDVELGDLVDEDDAEDEQAPRYAGVSSLTWSPTANELIFTAGGDLYRWAPGDDAPTRLTKTRATESGVQYLPDGAGYIYSRDRGLVRVRFGSHLIEQLDPELPSGETLAGTELSPDGKQVALLARKGTGTFGGGSRTVNIADYGDRFMQVRQVPRHVSDDPLPKQQTIYYLYVLPEPMVENGKLYKLHEHEHSGPRDAAGDMEWAPDSSRVAFSTYTQSTDEVLVFEARAPEPAAAAPDAPDAEQTEAPADWSTLVEQAKGSEAEAQDEVVAQAPVEHPARVVNRFLHNGGPNTPRMIDPQYLADSRRMVFVAELGGFRHLHMLDPLYEQLEPLTRGRFEVYALDMPAHREWMLVASTKESPSCNDVYTVDPESGEMTRLSIAMGRYESAVVSPDGRTLLANFESYSGPRELVRVDVVERTQTLLTDSHPKEAHELTQVTPEFFDYPNRHGQTVHGFVFKPEGATPKDKRPLLIYVYGGPLGTRKEVLQGSYSGSAYFFARYMCEKHGYVTATIDPRGMSGYGALFEKANFEQVGKPQVEDLVDGVKYLVEIAGVDPARVGIHGWSFGGFQTQMCLYTEPDVFACGIAGAGPTEWENYNSWYSTGTIGKSREGQPDLEKYSLLPIAKDLKHKLLLVHGMEDSNVLYQDTVRVYAELLKAGKETLVELFLDPSGGHGLGGHVKSLGRYKKYEEFLLRCLGSATP